jgi:hypothetical protein
MPDLRIESKAPWRRLGQLLRLSAAEERSERRSETRLPDHGPVALRWNDERGDPELALASLVDSSSAGVRVRCSAVLEPGCEVELEDRRSMRLTAVVRWVQRDGEDVEVGLTTALADSESSNGSSPTT